MEYDDIDALAVVFLGRDVMGIGAIMIGYSNGTIIVIVFLEQPVIDLSPRHVFTVGAEVGHKVIGIPSPDGSLKDRLNPSQRYGCGHVFRGKISRFLYNS